MRFLSIAALFGALALAKPVIRATGETVTVTDLIINQSNDHLDAVTFKLNVDDGITCSASNTTFPSPVVSCGTSDYRFALVPGKEVIYTLRLYHDLGSGAGIYGEATVPCNGPIPSLCEQVGLGFNVTLDSEP
ncbi:hypothetical protein MPH_02707 [Macrophomina phaseolina MS6]|uniref:AA1-like domain-containing protein n=2 Tax=Macrophomina phaseolina TaxID=35725 RepID=K2S4R2_MACPH|nr:hypothetical protein MPH_02707 [Macrophomina phaseolina MS6]KAH7045139.1 hypothetical protein B0J12DRAFT_787107 [Macrophomina phaseolina]